MLEDAISTLRCAIADVKSSLRIPMRYFIPIYLLSYIIAAFFWRSYVVWKKTGVNPVVFKGSDSAHDFIGRLFKALFAGIVVVVVIYSFVPGAYQYLMPIHWLERTWIEVTGIALLFVSLLWTIAAQAQMGNSWRIGIDTEHRTELVREGVFKISRNPIFVGMMVTLLGLFLVVPNVGTLVTLLVGIILVGIQVRLEEEYLARTHGDDYIKYRRNVRRWI
jgi:protein-S-isoprenylcysteine O-methyltransferase Ste14